MICPNFDGRGTIDEPIYDKSHTEIVDYETTICDVCGGKGEFNAFKEQTNEEWLRSCTTEELAEFIRKQRDDWSDGWYSDWHKTEEIINWLKEKHE